MKCQILFSRKNKENTISLSSAESAHRVVSVKITFEEVSGWLSGLVLQASNHEILLSLNPAGGRSAHDCTEPFIIILLSSRYDLHNVERDVKHQIIVIKITYENVTHHLLISLLSSATFFHRDWSWNVFCSYSLPSADSRRDSCQFLVKQCAQVLVNCLED